MNSSISFARIASLVCWAALIFSPKSSAQDFKYLEIEVLDHLGAPLADQAVDIKMADANFLLETNAQGMLSLNVPEKNSSLTLSARKPGYEPIEVRWKPGDEIPPKHTLLMRLGKPLQGTVLDQNNQPVTGAEVYTVSKGDRLVILNGHSPTDPQQAPVLSDANGRFTLPYLPSRTEVVCLSDVGWVQVTTSSNTKVQDVECRLTPWAKVELSTGFADTHPVCLHYLESQRTEVSWEYHGEASKQDKAVWQRVRSGTVLASRQVQLMAIPGVEVRGVEIGSTVSHGVVVSLKSGEQKQLQIGDAGQKVVGKLILPVDYDGKVEWSTGGIALVENDVVNLAVRTAIFEYGKILSQSNVIDPRDRIPSTGKPNYLIRYYATTIRPNGTFEIEGVPPGQYEFMAALVAKQPGATDLLRVKNIPCTITAAEQGSDAPYDLGKHVLDYSSRFMRQE